MQPPSDRNDKNPYATPSAWPRAPQQTFHIRVPKPPAGAPMAAQPVPPPRPPQPPKRPAPNILTGSALPAGYTAPLGPPEVTSAEAVPDIEPPAEPAADIAPAPTFIAPPETPLVTPIPTSGRRKSRAPLFVGAALAVTAGMALAVWLLTREAPEPAETMPAITAPAPSAPVITPPSLDYIMPESGEPESDGSATFSETAPAPVTRSRPSQQTPAAELPSGPAPYSGNATPLSSPPPVVARPAPVPPPPASAPGPTPPVADPDSPQTTRDPTSGN